MEEDIKKIQELVKEFCNKYNCAVELHTSFSGRDKNNILKGVECHLTINGYFK